MKHIIYLLFITILSFSNPALSSGLPQIPLSDINKKSDNIVLAEVIEVISDDALDTITISVSSVLKGSKTIKEMKVLLQVRGGMKEFDPILKKGDKGVFFLRSTPEGMFRTTHGGSIGIFTKNNFQ